MVSEQTHQGESLPVACLLTFAAGLLDIYSYMLRGHVFANAITGNMVLLGMNLAAGHWLNCGRYLFAISAYGAGILVANIIHEKIRLPWNLSWKQFVLFLEIVVLLPVAFIPSGDWNLLVNGMISFICAMQVRAFQHVHGLPFVSTTCTGNLRKGTNALFSGLFHHNQSLVAFHIAGNGTRPHMCLITQYRVSDIIIVRRLHIVEKHDIFQFA